MKKERHNYTPQEKVAIIRRHLIEKEPVSEICDRLNLQPNVFHRWMKEFFENGAAAFEKERRAARNARSSSSCGLTSWRRNCERKMR